MGSLKFANLEARRNFYNCLVVADGFYNFMVVAFFPFDSFNRDFAVVSPGGSNDLKLGS